MKYSAALLIVLTALFTSCRTDYDIDEVASAEYMGEDHHHDEDGVHEHADHEECGIEHDHHEDTHEENGHEASAISGSQMHLHEAGQRNHGTEWFFNQPWAARFIWGKMVRDSVILIALAAGILFLSRYRRKRG